MRKYAKWAVVGLLILSLGVLPGCLLCKLRPGVMAASARLDSVAADFYHNYPQVVAMVNLALEMGIPGQQVTLDQIGEWKHKVDDIYFNKLCPSETDVALIESLNNSLDNQAQLTKRALIHWKEKK